MLLLLVLIILMLMLMMLKNRSGLSSSRALAKAKAASINWMQLLTDLQASLQILLDNIKVLEILVELPKRKKHTNVIK